jgi:hypothetical protein
MGDRTTLLFALPDFRVLDVTREPDGGRRVLVECVAEDGGCPGCGVLSGLIKDRPTSRIEDLPTAWCRCVCSCASAGSRVWSHGASGSRSPRRPRSSRPARGSRPG